MSRAYIFSFKVSFVDRVLLLKYHYLSIRFLTATFCQLLFTERGDFKTVLSSSHMSIMSLGEK